MSMQKILSLFLFLFSLIGVSSADFSDGLDAYNAGDHEAALQEWLALAEEGDVRAQYNVGWMNAYGIGTLKDYEEAINWYRKSADQGFVHAQFNLGNMYLRGDGVEKDFSKAAEISYCYSKDSPLKDCFRNNYFPVTGKLLSVIFEPTL